MKIIALLHIDVENYRGEGPWQITFVDEEKGQVSFEAPCVPPIGTILHLYWADIKHVLMDAEWPLVEEVAHNIPLFYCHWQVEKHECWEVEKNGQVSVTITCHGYHSLDQNGQPDNSMQLDYKEVRNPAWFGESEENVNAEGG